MRGRKGEGVKGRKEGRRDGGTEGKDWNTGMMECRNDGNNWRLIEYLSAC